MWILAHFGVLGNEMINGIAKDGAKIGLYYPSNGVMG
jgi:hypothetical protein